MVSKDFLCVLKERSETSFMLHNKRNLYHIKCLLGILLSFYVVILQTRPVTAAAATSSDAKVTATSSDAKVIATNSKTPIKESRIAYDCDHLYINQETVIRIMLKNRSEQEDLKVVSGNKEIVQVKNGKWRGDYKTLLIIPKKAGTADVSITLKKSNTSSKNTGNDNQGKEELILKVHVRERSEMTPDEIYENSIEAMVEITTFDSINTRGLGSGFFISENEILTNYHVIQEANKLSVRDYTGKEYTVTHIVDYDTVYDLAILQVKEKSDHALILNTNQVNTGETVYALGSPLELTGTLSEGMVSKAYRQYENITYHQSTAYISKSSGGGPLLNQFGEVIGVNTLMILGNQNIYLAVDIQYISFLDRRNPKPIKALYEENQGKISIQTIYITIP